MDSKQHKQCLGQTCTVKEVSIYQTIKLFSFFFCPLHKIILGLCVNYMALYFIKNLFLSFGREKQIQHLSNLKLDPLTSCFIALCFAIASSGLLTIFVVKYVLKQKEHYDLHENLNLLKILENSEINYCKTRNFDEQFTFTIFASRSFL